jgi:hypothetical protein
MRGSKKLRVGASFGFTIMEIMVAIMILAVSVTSIFCAQFAAIATTEYSKNITMAIQLARCRMSEIELEVQTEGGFEESDVISSGDCCEIMENEDRAASFSCDWEIKMIDLPDITTLLSGGGPDGGTSMLDDPDFSDQADDMAGDLGIMGAASAFAPMLSGMLKEGIRRVTVTVKWKQGYRDLDFNLAQYIVHPTQGPLGLMNAAATAADIEEQAAMEQEMSQ